MLIPYLAACLLSHCTMAASDSTIAELTSRDSACRLVLSAHSIVFEFTEIGAARIQRDADASAPVNPDPTMRGLESASITAALRSMEMRFPIEGIERIEIDGAALTLVFRGRARPGRDRFDFVASDATAAQNLVSRFNGLTATLSPGG